MLRPSRDATTVGDMTTLALYVAGQPRPTSKIEVNSIRGNNPIVAEVDFDECVGSSVQGSSRRARRRVFALPVASCLRRSCGGAADLGALVRVRGAPDACCTLGLEFKPCQARSDLHSTAATRG